MKATFEVSLKAAIPVVTPATETEPQKIEVTKKVTGEQFLGNLEMFATVKALFNGLAVYETDMSVEQLKEAFTSMFGIPIHFVGYYAKVKDAAGKLGNIETETLTPKGWMYFSQHPKGSSRGVIRTMDLSSFLK